MSFNVKKKVILAKLIFYFLLKLHRIMHSITCYQLRQIIASKISDGIKNKTYNRSSHIHNSTMSKIELHDSTKLFILRRKMKFFVNVLENNNSIILKYTVTTNA
jgi:hypothetical protein